MCKEVLGRLGRPASPAGVGETPAGRLNYRQTCLEMGREA